MDFFTPPPVPSHSCRHPSDIQAHTSWFSRYVHKAQEVCEWDVAPMLLKEEHTQRVLENVHTILAGLELPKQLHRACLLAALYHDLGRFEQYLRYQTFKDALSCNHGELGASILEQFQVVQGEGDIAALIICAVRFHNRHSLPQHLTPEQQLVTNVVRDADKIDILRVIDEHLSHNAHYSPTVVLSLPDNELFSPKVIQCALEKTVAGYEDLQSVNDFRLLLGSWIYALSFSSSRALMALQGHAQHLLQQLPAQGVYAKARQQLLEAMAHVAS